MSFQITPTTHSFLTYSLSHHSSAPIYPFVNIIRYFGIISPSSNWMRDSDSSRSLIFCFKLIFSYTLEGFLSVAEACGAWENLGASTVFSPQKCLRVQSFWPSPFPSLLPLNIRNSIGAGWTPLLSWEFHLLHLQSMCWAPKCSRLNY